MPKEAAKKDIEIGKRIKERRIALRISQETVARALGVNKSTVQRYETQGVDPDKVMVIYALASILDTTEEWIRGETDEKCEEFLVKDKKEIKELLNTYFDTVCDNNQEVTASYMLHFIKNMIELFDVFSKHYTIGSDRAVKAIEDASVSELLGKYEIETAVIFEKVYKTETKDIINDMHRLIDTLYEFFDNYDGFEKLKLGDSIVENARKRFNEKYESVD